MNMKLLKFEARLQYDSMTSPFVERDDISKRQQNNYDLGRKMK